MTTLVSPTAGTSTADTTTADPAAGRAFAPAWLAELASAVDGRVATPTDADYPALTVPWNVAATSTPVAVVAAESAADVTAAVRFADRHDLDVAVQCTGHGAWHYDRPTLLVHTGLLQELTVDAAAGTARVGAGVRWQQVLDAAAPHGLAGLSGSSPHVGVVGYLTGGGLSPVARTYGYAADHVTAFDVVTGDGELRRATPTQNPALFWGLRGGKGALGIVTAVEFDLLPTATLLGGALYFDGADAAAVLHAWRDWSATLPEQATTSLAVLRLPPLPMVPPPLAGRCTVAVRFAWTGDVAEGRRVLAPMESVAPVVLGGVDVLPFTALGSIHADPVDPMPVHERSTLLHHLDGAGVDALLGGCGPQVDSPQVIVELRQLGGAIARAPRHDSAVCHRDAAFALLVIGIAAPPVLQATARDAEAVLAAMTPWRHTGGQPNFGVTTDPRQVARNYDAPTLARLATLVASYDPRGRIAAAHALCAAALGAGTSSAGA